MRLVRDAKVRKLSNRRAVRGEHVWTIRALPPPPASWNFSAVDTFQRVPTPLHTGTTSSCEEHEPVEAHVLGVTTEFSYFVRQLCTAPSTSGGSTSAGLGQVLTRGNLSTRLPTLVHLSGAGDKRKRPAIVAAYYNGSWSESVYCQTQSRARHRRNLRS